MNQLANLLEERAEELVRRWTDEIRRQLAPAGKSEPELRDHIPQVLRELTDTLRRGQAAAASAVAREHGRQRHRIGFRLDALVHEYGLLQRLILDMVEDAKQPVIVADVRVLSSFFAMAVAEGVAEYARQREQEREALLQQANSARAVAEAAQEKLDSLFTQAPVAVAMHEGPEHIYTFANARYRGMVGNRDVVGKPLLDAVPELTGQGFDALFDRVFATGESFVDEVPARVDRTGTGLLEDGFYKVVFTPKRNAQGAVDGVLQCATDVTEQVQARQRVESLAKKLSESEERLRQVMEASGVGIWEVNPETHEAFADARLRELFYLSADEPFSLEKGMAIIQPEDRPRVAHASTSALAGENDGKYHAEYRVSRRPGSPTRWIEARGRAHFGPDGSVARFWGTALDVTARKEAEATQTRLLTALADQPMLYVALLEGPELRFTMANPGYREIVGGREVVGKTLHEALPELEGQGIDALLHGVLETGKPFVGRELLVQLDRRGDGVTDAYFNFVYQAVPGPNLVAESVLVVGHDVTEEVLRRHEAQRQEKQRSDLEQQLIGIVSHDLRSPLNAIQLGTSALWERRESLDSGDTRILARVRSSAQRMSRLVHDLLDFTQARLGGGIPLTPEPLDLHVLARGAVEEVRSSFPGRDVRLEADGDGHGAWDADRLAQVLSNLVTNALKYSPAGSLVTVRTRGDGDAVLLEVHNLGAPIPAEALAHLFQPMWRADAQIDKLGRSVGLGLFIVKHLVDAHGGIVTVQSSAEGGTLFVVRLPRMHERPRA